MTNRKSLFILLLIISLFLGCTQSQTQQSLIESPDAISDLQTKSASPSTDGQNEISNLPTPGSDLSLAQTLALTLMHNPELKVFSLETRAAQARQLQAGLWPNPELEIETENVGGTGELSGFDSAETTIQLSQLIELGNKAGKREKVASLERKLADLDCQNQKLEIFSQASKAFISVLKAQEKQKLSAELLKLSQQSYKTVLSRVDAGKDSPLEKNRASVNLANMEIAHQLAQQDIAYAKKQLASLWAQDNPQFDQAAGNLEQIQQLPDLENLLNQLKINPAYIQSEVEINKNKAALDLEKANALGDISVAAGIKRFNETDDNAFIFGISIPLPISNRNQGAKKEAFYNLAKSREAKKATWLKLQNEFNQAYQELANSYSQAEALKNHVLPSALEMFDAATKAYQQGKTDYLNFLDAHRTLFEVKNEYIESLAAYHIAKTDIERLSAKINP